VLREGVVVAPMGSDVPSSLSPRAHALAHFVLVVVAAAIGGLQALLAGLADAHEGPGADALASHGLVSFYVAMVPALTGIVGNLVVPRALGVRAMALPRLGRAGVVLHALGLVLAVVAMSGGGVRPGWLLTDAYDADLHDARVLWLGAAIAAITLSGALASTSLLVTMQRRVLVERHAPTSGLVGLAIGAAAQCVTAPAMVLAVALVVLERTFHLGVLDAHLDGSALLLPHLVWFHVQSVLVGTFAASIGLADEILAEGTLASPSVPPRRLVASLVVLVLAHSFAAALDPGVTPEGDHRVLASGAFRLLAVSPLLWIAVRWLGLLRRGARLTTSTVYALGLVPVLALAAPALVALSIPALGQFLAASSFASGTLHLVASGAALVVLAAAHRPGSVLAPRGVDEDAGRRIAALVVAGVLVAFVPMLILGARGMPSPMHLGPQGSPWLALSELGGGGLVVGGALAIVNLLRPWLSSLRGEARAE